MTAVVMCGGLGSRMLPLSEKTPKPMLKTVNRPVIDIIIDKLIRDGFREIVLTLGYKADEIAAYVEERQYDAEVRCCAEDRPLGTAGGVKHALKDSTDDFLVLSGDNVFDFDLDSLREQHYLSGRRVTIVGTVTEDPRDYGVIVRGEDGAVREFVEKPDWENVRSFLVNTGIYFCANEVLGLIPDGEFFDFAKNLFPLLLKQGGGIGCAEAEGHWYDIGGIDEYLSTNAVLLREPDLADAAGGVYYGYDRTDEDGNRFVAPCLVGDGVVLGGGVTVGPYTCLADGVSVGRDCVISGSIVGEGCQIGSGTDIHTSVVAEGARIRENVLVDDGAVVGYGADIGRFSRIFPGVKISSGIRVPPESLVSSDVREQGGVSAVLALYGMSGKAFSGVTPADALKIGQALASAPCGRIGFACDGSPVAEVFKNVCLWGAVSCGAEAYDFDVAFRGQVCFYSQHCSLAAFVYVFYKDDAVSFSFAGENGFAMERKRQKAVSDRFRYGSFRYAEQGRTGRHYRMELFSSVYKSKLRRLFRSFREKVELTVESSNRCLTDTVGDVLQYPVKKDGMRRLMFITDGSGSDAYFAEEDKVYYISAVQLFLCEYEFARGVDLVVPEDAPELIERKAETFGRKVWRIGPDTAGSPDKSLIFNSLWLFDSVFLAFRLCELMAETGLGLSELLNGVETVSVRKNVCEFDCAPGVLHKSMEQCFGQRDPGSPYYRVSGEQSSAKVRQLGNSSRVRILSESADMEAAKELTGEIMRKIHQAVIDNTDKIE